MVVGVVIPVDFGVTVVVVVVVIVAVVDGAAHIMHMS